jgi:hypothetical protein
VIASQEACIASTSCCRDMTACALARLALPTRFVLDLERTNLM